MFKKIHLILISPDGPTRAPYNRSLHIKVDCALIEYESAKAKPAHYFIQLINLNDSNEQ